MQEYNWKKEREKYRPDFMKQPEPVKEPAAPPPPPPAVKRSYAGWVFAALVLAVVGFMVVAFALNVNKGKESNATTQGSSASSKQSGDSATMLAQAAERSKNAVGLVILNVELKNGKKIQEPIGTAWAFAPNKFATNAHVANGISEKCDEIIKALVVQSLKARAEKAGFKSDVEAYLNSLDDKKSDEIIAECMKEVNSLVRGFSASILINGTHHKSFAITHVQIHRDFGVTNTSFDPDVAALTIDGTSDAVFKIADDQTLETLKSGDNVAFLGFPMEYLDNDNVNLDNPVASMQSGIVVAVSDFDMKDAGPAGNYLIRHNLPSTGGASGSPIFNKNGEVVALLYAGNTIGQVKNGRVTRAPSAAQINFGVRSDLIQGLGPAVDIQKLLP